ETSTPCRRVNESHNIVASDPTVVSAGPIFTPTSVAAASSSSRAGGTRPRTTSITRAMGMLLNRLAPSAATAPVVTTAPTVRPACQDNQKHGHRNPEKWPGGGDRDRRLRPG